MALPDIVNCDRERPRVSTISQQQATGAGASRGRRCKQLNPTCGPKEASRHGEGPEEQEDSICIGRSEELAILPDNVVSLGALIAKTGARISVTGLPAVDADPVQLQELFQNLISNAIKYHRQGEVPVIEIRGEAVPDGWRFAVKDNGEGILPEHQVLIFEALKRLHGSDTPGCGLGLALCKTIVARHGGRIWVESEGAGRGATFFFTLAATSQESRTLGQAKTA